LGVSFVTTNVRHQFIEDRFTMAPKGRVANVVRQRAKLY